MAKQLTAHGKYGGIIVSRTDIRQIRKRLDLERNVVRKMLVERLSQVGEMAVATARERGSYNDVTGNLRSSVGYVVLLDGKPVVEGAGQSYGNGGAGVAAGKELLKKLETKFQHGVVLIVCAGMDYAAYVEAVHGKDVLTSAELVADDLAKRLLKNLTEA